MASIKFILLVAAVAVGIECLKLPCDQATKSVNTAEAENIKENLPKGLTGPKIPIKKDLFKKALKDDASSDIPIAKRNPVNTGAVPIVPLGAEPLTGDKVGEEVPIVQRKPIYGGPQPIVPYSGAVDGPKNGGESGNPLGNLILNGTGDSEVPIPPRNPIFGGPEPIVPHNGAVDETPCPKKYPQSGNPLGGLILNGTDGPKPNIPNNGGDESSEEVPIPPRNPIYGGPEPIVPYDGVIDEAPSPKNVGQPENPLGGLILNVTSTNPNGSGSEDSNEEKDASSQSPASEKPKSKTDKNKESKKSSKPLLKGKKKSC